MTNELMRSLVLNGKNNAIASWMFILAIFASFVESIFTFDLSWVLFTGILLIILTYPLRKTRSFTTMLPWELLLVTAIPVMGRALQWSFLTNQIALYFSFAAIALVIAVELHVFTKVKMTSGFSILFVILSTLAVAGFWSVILWFMDINLGTSFIFDNRALMLDLFGALIGGIVGGFLFEFYFRRYSPAAKELRDREF